MNVALTVTMFLLDVLGPLVAYPWLHSLAIQPQGLGMRFAFTSNKLLNSLSLGRNNI